MNTDDFKYYGKPIGIPVVGVGSQPSNEGDEDFAFQASPGTMPTYRMPHIPEPEEVVNLMAGKQVLAELLLALQRYEVAQETIILDITHLDRANLNLVNQVLNEGEVSVVHSGTPRWQMQESVLTGVWRVQCFDAQQQLLHDWIEIADIPRLVRELAFADAKPVASLFTQAIPSAAYNAPALLTEIAEQVSSWRMGAAAHVINMTLLPLAAEDIVCLGERLGVGAITILSRGYGNCRVGSTQQQNVWWVKFYNSDDALILNTIEIVDVPLVALAAPEDIMDSQQRLAEILEVYQ